MMRQITCVVCPNGCEIKANMTNEGVCGVVLGALCKRGVEFARQEMVMPMRSIASSVLVIGGDQPLVSVRTDRPIPKKEIFHVMEQIRSLRKTAPVHVGDVLISNVLGLDCNIIATSEVEAEKC